MLWFTPLENLSDGGDDTDKNTTPYRKGDVKALSFLTGLAHSPLTVACLGFVFGMILSESIYLSSEIFYIVLFSLAFIYVILKKAQVLRLFCILIIFIQVGAYRFQVDKQITNKEVQRLLSIKESVEITGEVVEVVTHEKDALEDYVEPGFAGGYLIIQLEDPIKIKVNYYNINPDLMISDIVCLKVKKLTKPKGPTNPGQKDYAQFLVSKGVYLTCYISRKDEIFLLKRGGTLAYHIEYLRLSISNAFNDLLSPDNAGYLSGIILGYRHNISLELRTNLQRTGTAHFLAISGLNLMIVFAILWFCLVAVGVTGRTRDILLIVILSIYVLISGLASPVLRAYLMVVIYLSAGFFFRKRDAAGAISLSCLILLLINPADLFNLSFQLSYLAVIGIVFLGQTLRELFKTSEHGNFVVKYLAGGLSISLSAWLYTNPLTLFYFNIMTPIVVLANIILSPLIFLQTVIGILLIVTVPGFLYSIPAFLSDLLFKTLEIVTQFLSFLPFSYIYVDSPSQVHIIFYYLILIGWTIWCRNKMTWPKFSPAILLILSGVIPMLFIPRIDSLNLETLDVGKGSAVYVELPDGTNFIYDAGSDSMKNSARTVIAPYILHRKRRSIGAIILSHPDSDHTNAVRELVDFFHIEKVIVSQYFDTFSHGKALLDFISKKGIQIVKLQPVETDFYRISANIEVLGPPNWKKWAYKPTTNETSLIVRIIYRGKTILLTGDIEEKSISYLLSTQWDLRSSVILAPHHGRFFKNHKDFLARAEPEVVLVSSAHDQYSDHVINTCKESGSQVYITAISGAIDVHVDETGIKVVTFFE